MELVALLSGNKETWPQVAGLMTHGEWDKIIILGNDDAKNFIHQKKFDFVKIDFFKKLIELREDLTKKLQGKFEGMEVACSIASGEGKEHMALISALINLPVGVRFAALTREGVVYL